MGGSQRKQYATFSDPEAIQAQLEAAQQRSEVKKEFSDEDDDQDELTQVIRSMQQDPALFTTLNLGLDGVLRTLSIEREVIDAVALPRRLCKAMLDRFPWDQQIEDDFRGVDGMKVPRRLWFYPDQSLLPPRMTEEQKVQSRRRLRENREMLLMRDCKVKIEEDAGRRWRRRPSVISDYDLEPRWM